ncbi:24-hydroxycholesterol 7-alpha-hydroxylase isoform 2 [Mus musculus]|uniref:Cytochrome P450, family 39, subfamily a, polypeptide 1 n=1 Tax=Mus musculus TaxID=10090 RepID=A0A3B2WCK5_MOUSE|nr:24-hydroxycholesterol 7-alpha-hydroxylase isoform 2 [Mus musculus]EDL23411.1 cytochrome P450, family 39, subfamily a, polypeptide 1, isoform CRA_a [Mus musculus]|eukprot:NP_001272876.1 24-hydroxycholesterol 7-alpha-hydroxylase isoform 2 [Mus musculus]
MGIMELFSPIAIAVLGSCVLFLFSRLKNLLGPPCIQGWIPWIGAGLEFGKAPLEFIEKARIKYGPVFTIFAMGNRMTFVSEEEGINVLLKSEHVDFESAVQSPVYHTAWIPKNVFSALHERLYALMKGKMGTFNTHHFTGPLTEELHEQLEGLGTHGTMDLNDFVRNWSKSKRWLLALFEKNIGNIKAHGSAGHSGTLLQAILEVVETETRQYSPNYGLVVLWAALANAPPIAFWTLGYILSHPDIHRTVLESISSVFGTAGKDKIKVSEDDLKKLLIIKWCILESVRLRAPGVITRKVVKPVKILNHTVPSGDLLMLSPFWLHRNPKYFPEPESFKPERWKEANLDKYIFLDYFMAFGGGKFQCPGRWFALLEIQLCIILVLYKYECSLLDPLPKQSSRHLVGVPQPAGKCRIEYKQRA